jgi:hypothetical protein
MEWTKVLYNGFETNVEVTKCGKARKIRTNWEIKKTPIGEIDFSKYKLDRYLICRIKVNKLGIKLVRLHQLIAAAFLDYKFDGRKLVVDHIDSNKLNNNLSNLQVVSHRENTSKERRKKTEMPTGVFYLKDKKIYKVSIGIKKIKIHLGYFKTIKEAEQAYINKLKTL